MPKWYMAMCTILHVKGGNTSRSDVWSGRPFQGKFGPRPRIGSNQASYLPRTRARDRNTEGQPKTLTPVCLHQTKHGVASLTPTTASNSKYHIDLFLS